MKPTTQPIMKTDSAIESLAKHVRGLSNLGFGQFKLQTLDGISFAILQDGSPVYRGRFESVAKHVGFELPADVRSL